MSEPVFVVRNQHGQYLTRHDEWVDGHDPAPLFKTPFRDVALNTLIEQNSRDIELRGVITAVELNDKGLPRVTPCATAITPAGEIAASADEEATRPASESASGQ